MENNLNYPVAVTREDGAFIIASRDLEGLNTYANQEDDLITIARDAILTLLDYRLDHGMGIPTASPTQPGEVLVPLSIQTQQKIQLRLAMQAKGWRVADLARALDVEHHVATRMVDLFHSSAQKKLDEAIAAVGMVGVFVLIPAGRLAA